MSNKPTSGRFFSKCTHNIGTKNKLQEVIAGYVKSLERQILDKEGAAKLITECEAKVAEFNQIFRRCKAERVMVYTDSNSGDFKLHFGDFINIQLYREKEVENEQ